MTIGRLVVVGFLAACAGVLLLMFQETTQGVGPAQPTDFVLVQSIYEVCERHIDLDAGKLTLLKSSWGEFEDKFPDEALLARMNGFGLSKSIGNAAESGEQALASKCLEVTKDIRERLGSASPLAPKSWW